MVTFLPLFIALPLAMAFFIPIIGHTCKFLPAFVGNLAAFTLMVFSLLALGGTAVYHVGGWPPALGIPLVLDNFSGLFLAITNLVAFLVAFYSINYIGRFYTSKLRYYTLFLVLVAGINGVILSGDIFNIYVFMEIASIASYALVGFGCRSYELEGAFKYLVTGTIGSCFILLGIALIYGDTGTLNLALLAQTFSAGGGLTPVIQCALVLLTVGFLTKTGIAPFHAWLPDAYPSAPAPISALLAGAASKSLGIYVLVRLVFNVFGAAPLMLKVFVYAGLLSIMLGGLLALRQRSFKRLLAYSSIGQMGYVMLGFGLGTELGILGAIFHLLNHSLFKSLLFLDAGAVEYGADLRNLDKMGRLSEKLPVTTGTTLAGAFSLAGMPPFAGFWSKLLIIFAAVQAGYPGAAFWAVLGAFLTVAYCTRFLKNGFFGEGRNFDRERWAAALEVPGVMRISLIVLALLCLAGGLLITEGGRGLLGAAAQELGGGASGYIEKVLY